MGVPTLTLAGSTAPGRIGASSLGNVGLEEFIAHDAEDFVQKGIFWAGNLATLSEIRFGLRDRFNQSVLGRPELIADSLAHALRIMWQRWCAYLPPEAFEATA
jgi:predicted O-linked N-acetylglucosamine transferase (SPINDLY family)